MIIGSVNAFHEAVVRLVVANESGKEFEIEAVLDTGYTASLTLPPEIIAELELPYRQRGLAELADGSTSVFDVHDCLVDWAGQRRRVAVDAADTDPLLGMGLLHGFEVTIQVVEGGTVSLRQLRDS